MKTNYVPAIVMLLAGGVYCLFGICYQTPLIEFLVQLLSILIIFWIIGGVIRMAFDRLIIKFEDKPEEDTKVKEKNSKEDSEDVQN